MDGKEEAFFSVSVSLHTFFWGAPERFLFGAGFLWVGVLKGLDLSIKFRVSRTGLAGWLRLERW